VNPQFKLLEKYGKFEYPLERLIGVVGDMTYDPPGNFLKKLVDKKAIKPEIGDPLQFS
jgi:hypothetical protein